MPCCSVTVGTVGCPLSGMHQSVSPPVPSLHFVSFAAWQFTPLEPLLLLPLLLCTDLPAGAVAVSLWFTSKLRSAKTCEFRTDSKAHAYQCVFSEMLQECVSSEETDLWERKEKLTFLSRYCKSLYYPVAGKYFILLLWV